MLEEAVQLVKIAVRDGQERLDRHLIARGAVVLGAADVADLYDEVVAEPLHAADHRDQIATLEAPRQHVRIPEGARLQSAGAVPQLQREICAPSARLQPILAHARVDTANLIARA